MLTHAPRTRCSPVARVVTPALSAPMPSAALEAARPYTLAMPHPRTGRHARPGKRVLIVEDDDLTRAMLTTILQAEGYRTESAGNGREALARLCRAAVPDLILLDLLMPVMNGWEFRAAQLEDPRLALIPVVVVSATGEPAENGPALRPVAHLRKPITVEELLAVVGRS